MDIMYYIAICCNLLSIKCHHMGVTVRVTCLPFPFCQFLFNMNLQVTKCIFFNPNSVNHSGLAVFGAIINLNFHVDLPSLLEFQHYSRWNAIPLVT